VHPGAVETCNDVDDDCDGYIDQDDPDLEGRLTLSADEDGDGYGGDHQQQFCNHPGLGWKDDSDDCDDGDAAIHPDAQEYCNGIDDDCDGDIDEDGALDSSWYLDGDGDGWGDTDQVLVQCAQPSGYVLQGRDCDDGDPGINPGASEHCDGVDEDCDGAVDNDAVDAPTWYHDGDGDGYGDEGDIQQVCEQPVRHVAVGGDCDDDEGSVHPGASEHCDHLDEDCDGAVDEDPVDAPSWHPDADGDGYGSEASVVQACEAPSGWIANGTDCDDGDDGVYPGATEDCNGLDDDCDGAVDEGTTGSDVWYRDADGDGHGNPAISVTACGAPGGYVASGADCDDTDPTISPSASERCNGVDDDCDGSVDSPATAAFVAATGALTDLTALLASGTATAPYVQTISTDGTLYLCDGSWFASLIVDTVDFTLVGFEGSGASVLEGDGSDAIIHATSGVDRVTLAGVSLVGGGGSDGGCVYGSDHGVDLILDDVVLSACEASGDGGGLYLESGELTAWDLVIEACSAGGQGGALYTYDSAVTLDGGSIEQNLAGSNGGGMFLDAPSSLAVDGLALRDNVSGGYGGGAYLRDGSGTLLGLEVDGNSASYAGGLMFNGGIVNLQTSEVIYNEASAAGGGIYVTGGVANILECAVHHNELAVSSSGSEVVGGGLFLNNGAQVSCTGTTAGSYGFWNNTATWGAGGFIYDATSVFESIGCDWGNGSSDNDPDDFAVLVGALSYAGFHGNEDFVCTSKGCW
jgi:hypothetical protein